MGFKSLKKSLQIFKYFYAQILIALSAVKQLAGQTMWYGVSNIAARFLNYLLTPLITYLMQDKEGLREYGDYSLMYAWIAVFNIIFTYGFETGYFRFSNKEGINRTTLFNTSMTSLLLSSIFLVLGLSFLRVPMANFLGIGNHPEYIIGCLLIIAFDAISAIPFAKLRQEGRPKKYAFVKVFGIVINILFTVLFLVYLPKIAQQFPDGWLHQFYTSNNKVGFLILANILQNLFVFLVLFKEWRGLSLKIDRSLWGSIFKYSSPMILIGLAGMVNEVLDRTLLAKLLPPEIDAKRLVGIYSANYKLAIFISLFIQAFKMAAEPFFFNQSKDKNAPATYAKVMKWFVLMLSFAFLSSALFLDVLQHIVPATYRSGIGIVPILLMANVFLGIYYNLSVWYKLVDKMYMGIIITLMGAVITLVLNVLFIPQWGMYAAAWATLACYGCMVVVTYFVGQKYFPVPYPVKKLLSYLSIALILFFVKIGLDNATEGMTSGIQLTLRLVGATAILGAYGLMVLKIEAKELKQLPFIGKFLK